MTSAEILLANDLGTKSVTLQSNSAALMAHSGFSSRFFSLKLRKDFC
jgi:hypothetical protein